MASFTDTENRAIQFLSDGQISFTLPGEDITFGAMQARMCVAGVFPFADVPLTVASTATQGVLIVRAGYPIGGFHTLIAGGVF